MTAESSLEVPWHNWVGLWGDVVSLKDAVPVVVDEKERWFATGQRTTGAPRDKVYLYIPASPGARRC